MNLLHGAHILVTRPTHQANHLCNQICEYGGLPFRFPTIEIAPINISPENKCLLDNLSSFDWIIFTSVNAVNFALKANGGKIPIFKKPPWIAAIGAATAKALDSAGVIVDVTPEKDFSSEALISEIPDEWLYKNKQCLIVRGLGGREELGENLRKCGVYVHYLEVYQRIIPEIDNTPVLTMLADNKLTCITITSGEAIQNLLKMIDKSYHPFLFDIPVAVISNRIKDIAIALGFTKVVATNEPSDAAMLDTIIKLLNEG